MDLSFYPLTLEAVDQAAAESLCLFVAEDERPLTGLAGLADWRLSGKLSRLLRAGVLTGGAGEAVLTPPGTRLGFRKLFVFGTGPLDAGEEALASRVVEGLQKMSQAGVHEAAMQLPAGLSPELGIGTLIGAPHGPSRALIFGPDPARLVSALSRAAKRGAVQHERRVVKVAAPQKAPPLPRPPAPRIPTPPSIPRASPLPFAPSGEPARLAPPAPIPRASPLPFAPSPEGNAGATHAAAAPPAPAAAAPEAAPAPETVAPEAAAPEAASLAPEAPARVPGAPAAPASPAPALEGAAARSAAAGRAEHPVPPDPQALPPLGPARTREPESPSGSFDPGAASPSEPADPGQKGQPSEHRPAPPPPQRYVPPTPKPSVFDSSRGKKKPR